MPPIRMDMNASQFNVLPEGDYAATIVAFKYKGLSKGQKIGGAPAYSVQFKIDEGGSVWDNYYIHASTIFRLKNLLVAAGVDTAELSGERSFLTLAEVDEYPEEEDPIVVDDLLAEIVGTEVVVTLGIRPASGNYAEQNEVKKIVAADSLTTAWRPAA